MSDRLFCKTLIWYYQKFFSDLLCSDRYKVFSQWTGSGTSIKQLLRKWYVCTQTHDEEADMARMSGDVRARFNQISHRWALFVCDISGSHSRFRQNMWRRQKLPKIDFGTEIRSICASCGSIFSNLCIWNSNLTLSFHPNSCIVNSCIRAEIHSVRGQTGEVLVGALSICGHSCSLLFLNKHAHNMQRDNEWGRYQNKKYDFVQKGA